MKNKTLEFVYKHLYLVWGTVVVCSVTFLTGALTATIIGTTAGLSLVAITERILK